MTDCAGATENDGPTRVADLLRLSSLSPNTYLADAVRTGRRPLFGGQLVAQAIRAAAHTVPDGRVLHSVHAYFPRPARPHEPFVLRVQHDTDGRRYSTRRVTATQSAEILYVSCSFARPTVGPDYQAVAMPAVQPPADLPDYPMDSQRLFDLEARLPADTRQWHRWPTRLWVRVREPLHGDANDAACAVVFVSDVCTGLSLAPDVQDVGLLPSIDHAVWLHRPAQPNDWMLLDLEPVSTAAGRGVYTGKIFAADGTLLATLAQESLFDPARGKPRRLSKPRDFKCQ
jgi:acyl-CoA thioesterase II